MTITNKGNYVVIDTGKQKYSIAKGAVIVTQSEDSVQLRLNGSRRVLVNIPTDNPTALVEELRTKLY